MLRDIGVFRLCSDSEWRRSRLSILCYHGVSIDDEHEWNPSLYISVDTLEQRLALLKAARYNVLPLGEAITRLYTNTLPERCVCITFDDGMHDFAVRAAPVLERYGFPATVYLTTYYCEVRRPIFGLALAYVMWKRRRDVLHAPELIGDDRWWNLADESEKTDAYWSVIAYANDQDLSVFDRDALVRAVAEQLGVDYDEVLRTRHLQLLSPDEVASLSARGFDIQLHTHRHRTPVNEGLFRRELRDNRRRIREYTGKDPTHFCYPSGVYRPEFYDWLRGEQVATATTCDPGVATRHTPALQLPRLVDSSRLSAVEFEGWLTGVSSMLPHRPAAAAKTGA
ncbi:MAG TPA: polysaccharide deacetylase family protein [Gemmatimonadaceae bacterium]|nr:polysaccharide deacetylase family protein [Gemmatimonadaceae bacterium]